MERTGVNEGIPRGCGTKAGLLLVALLVIIIAAALYVGWLRNPPDTPEPPATAAPAPAPAEGDL